MEALRGAVEQFDAATLAKVRRIVLKHGNAADSEKDLELFKAALEFAKATRR